MSAETRKALAAAASTVRGVTVHPTFVQTTEAGVGVVRLDHIDYPDNFGGIEFYDVVVFLPQDYATSEALVDRILPQLVDALADEMTVQNATPQQVQINNVGTVPALFISGHL